MAKKKKYYVVWKGRKTGVFESWDECRQQVEGFTDAKYKSFPTKQLAEEALVGNSADFIGQDFFESELSKEELERIGRPNLNSLSVDAACDSTTGLMEYQGVDTKTGKVIFKEGPFEGGTNNVGEFLAIVHALALLQKMNNRWPVYTDSATAMSWVRNKRAKTQLIKTEKNAALFDLIARAETWLRENEYENEILKWETKAWGEIAADFGRK